MVSGIPAFASRGFQRGQVAQISVEPSTTIWRSFQQHHGAPLADSQYGRGMSSVGTDQ
ncbi:MAG: hypothetical protein ABL971_14305 [Vicinamibacterales bacterium]